MTPGSQRAIDSNAHITVTTGPGPLTSGLKRPKRDILLPGAGSFSKGWKALDSRSFRYAMWATFYRVILRWQSHSGIITQPEADYWKAYFSRKMGNVLAGKH